ncbi:unnamed protein product [Arabidopsis halleri]
MLKLCLFTLVIINNVAAESSTTCLSIYKHGGAPAVFRSPNCPLWNLQNRRSFSSSTSRCHTAAIQGRRKYQEDRLLCALDLRIPFPGKKAGTPKDVVVGIAAVFDGHNGAEASEMASQLLLDYFALHTYFLLDATFSKELSGTLPNSLMHLYDLNFQRFQDSLPLNFGDSLHLDILKEALLRAIHDIDATFTKEASNRKLDSGSTATVALTADGQLLVASIGDSKALLCSEKFETPEEARATLIKFYRECKRNQDSSPSRFSDLKLEHRNGLMRFIAKELTKDHHPNREDEMLRVKAAGGYVTEWAGVPRVNGQLAVSRSIGDLTYKSYGVISAPEVMDWQPLVANDSYLVVSSDGIFEKLEVQDVCDRLWEVKNQTSFGAGVPSISLAECLVNTAFEKGSMDNMAAVVVPLKSNLDWQSQPKEQSEGGNIDEFSSRLQMKNTYKYALPYRTFGALQLKQAQPVSTMVNELLVFPRQYHTKCVEVENKSFHMAENLDASSG